MSLRDWFAGMALQGILSQPDERSCPIEEAAATQAEWRKSDAEFAYKYADAMLAARERKESA